MLANLWKIDFPTLFDGPGLTFVEPLPPAVDPSRRLACEAFGLGTDGGGDGEGGDGGSLVPDEPSWA